MLLCRFAFYSRRNWSTETSVDDDLYLQKILNSGLRNNPRHGLTGVLLVDGPVFIQVLEGSRNLLYDTLKRIERNPGHSDLVLTGYSEISDRMFEGWSVLIRTPPTGLVGTPWIPNPELATHGQLINMAKRVSTMTDGVRKITLPDDGFDSRKGLITNPREKVGTGAAAIRTLDDADIPRHWPMLRWILRPFQQASSPPTSIRGASQRPPAKEP